MIIVTIIIIIVIAMIIAKTVKTVCSAGHGNVVGTANPRTNIVDFRGFDSNIILTSRGGILRPIGDFTESLSQAMLVGCNVSREVGRSMLHS